MAGLAPPVRLVAMIAIGVILIGGITMLGKILLWPERLAQPIVEHVDVDIHLTGVELSQGKDGKKLWHVRASSAGYAEATNDVTLSQPIITYWGDSDEPAVLIRAPHGQVWQKEDRARLWDGVNASRGEYTLHAQTAEYQGSNRELLLKGYVRMVGPTMMASSDALTYFVNAENFVAVGNVLVILN